MPAAPLVTGPEAVKPRIGADKFRALAERLKKPAAASSPFVSAPLPTPPEPAVPVLSEPFLAQPEPLLANPEPVPDHIPAPEPIPPLPQFSVPAPESPAPASPEPLAFPEPMPVPPGELPALVPTVGFEPLPPATAESPVPWTPLRAEIGPFESAAPVAPAAPPVSPLERVLSADPLRTASAIRLQLPEILPAPPLPEPVAPEPEGAIPAVVPPTMEVVQERLRGDASSRLEQLDIENIWRQVLATPTLEERADYLQEAAEIMAAEQAANPLPAAILPEHDLSRIAPAASGPDGFTAADPDEAGSVVPSPDADIALPVQDKQNTEQLETAELARSLLDMMASGANSGLPHERALAADTLLRLMPKLSEKPLTMMAQRLAMMDDPPQLLVGKLIRDERVEVSGPLLEDCMHITDQDLAMVLAEGNPGKRRMLARRRKLSRAISDQLIATRDRSVLLTLVRNANAEISHEGFVALIAAAEKMSELMAPLGTRADLSAPNAFELFWPAPAQLRRYLLHRFLTDSETLTKILKITLSTQDSEETREYKLPSAGDVMELLDVACRGRMETAAASLGAALGVDAATIHRILLDRQGEAMVVMLKAAGYPRSAVGDLLPALKRGEIALIDPERDVSELQTMFDTLSLNKARILLTYWDWAVRKAGPYAPVH